MSASVLIVDDNVTVRMLAVRVLNLAGYTTQEASTGAEAREQLRIATPSAALVDVKLPDCNGYELASSWPKQGFLMPVILSSGFARDDVLPADAHALPFLRKPFRPAQLRAAIEEAIRT